jgi:hypothetical protein
VAQPGSVLAWGASGRPFKSARPDHNTKPINSTVYGLFLFKLFDDAIADIAEGSNVIGKDLEANGHKRFLMAWETEDPETLA